MSKLIEMLKTIEPRTEQERLTNLKNYFKTVEDTTTLKQVKKDITEILAPYDYSQIIDDIILKFGIVYKVAEVKKVLNAVDLFQDI